MLLRRCMALTLVLLLWAPAGCGRGAAPIALPSIPALTWIEMVDASTGWARSEGSILRTSDGGATWADVTPPGAPDLGVGGACCFLDGRRGWVAAPDASSSGLVVVYSTQDGGASWSRAATGVQGLSARVQFLDGVCGWALVGQGAAAGSEEVAVLGTADGGATWGQVASTGSGARPGSLPFAGSKSGLGFSTQRDGWVTGYQPVDGVPYLYATGDGGRTWGPVSLRLPAGRERAQATTMPPVFFSAQEGILPVMLFAAEGPSTVFYATRDGGATWTPGAGLTCPPDGRLCWDFADAAHGFVVAGERMYLTADGGGTWKTVSPSLDLSGVTQVCFVSSRDGWALGEGVLLRTADGGRTWKAVAGWREQAGGGN